MTQKFYLEKIEEFIPPFVTSCESMDRLFDELRENNDQLLKKNNKLLTLSKKVDREIGECFNVLPVFVHKLQQFSDSLNSLLLFSSEIHFNMLDILRIGKSLEFVAVNFKIESARVGQNIYGFSNIADQILTMSDETKNQSKNIIRNIHEFTKELRIITDAFTKLEEFVEKITGNWQSLANRLQFVTNNGNKFIGCAQQLFDLIDNWRQSLQSITNTIATLSKNDGLLFNQKEIVQQGTYKRKSLAVQKEMDQELDAFSNLFHELRNNVLSYEEIFTKLGEDTGKSIQLMTDLEQIRHFTFALIEISSQIDEVRLTAASAIPSMEFIIDIADEIELLSINSAVKAAKESSTFGVFGVLAHKVAQFSTTIQVPAKNITDICQQISSLLEEQLDKSLMDGNSSDYFQKIQSSRTKKQLDSTFTTITNLIHRNKNLQNDLEHNGFQMIEYGTEVVNYLKALAADS